MAAHVMSAASLWKLAEGLRGACEIWIALHDRSGIVFRCHASVRGVLNAPSYLMAVQVEHNDLFPEALANRALMGLPESYLTGT